MRAIFLRFYAKYFAKKKYLKLNNLLIDMGLRGIGILNFESFSISGERFFLDLILKNYQIEVVFDIGANVGQYSRLFESQMVYAFEPNPLSFKILKNTFKNAPSINTYKIGFSDREEKSYIYDRRTRQGSSLSSVYKRVISDIHQLEASSTMIDLTTLDKFVSENSIETISLLKVDTEGHELAVLKGAIQTINKNIIDIIHFEFNEMNTVSKVFLIDFIDLLPNYNFYRLLPNELLPIHYKKNKVVKSEIFAYQNIISIRKDLDVFQ